MTDSSSTVARFIDQVAIVTGAARGIGAAIAARLAAEGALVVIVDRDPSAEDAAAALRESGGRAEAVVADVTDAAAVDELVADVAARHGRLDVLVNNAGVTRDNLIFKLDEADWDTVLDVNLKSAFLCSRAAQRAMVEAKSRRDRQPLQPLGARQPRPGQLQRRQGRDQGPDLDHGDRARPVRHQRQRRRPRLHRHRDDRRHRRAGSASTPPSTSEKAAAATPLRRVGTPEDVASVVAFLASDDAAYVSGQTIEINGGAR